MSERRDQAGWVYVIGGAESSRVKIGTSIDPESRLALFQSGSPVKLSILFRTPGGLGLERSLHQHFRSYRSHGEWFDFGSHEPVAMIRDALRAIAEAEQLSASAFTEASRADVVRDKVTQRFECANTLADAEQAAYFGVDLDSPLVMRRRWSCIGNIPSAIESSWFPEWLVNALPALRLARDISGGTSSYMAANGYPIGWSVDHYSGRPFTPEEASFTLPPFEVYALVKCRISSDQRGGRVLRLKETVLRTDRGHFKAGPDSHQVELRMTS
jgi:DNA-binding GntR family transcriptional regulator